MLYLDHIAVVAEDLEVGRLWVERSLGVPLQPGGKHDLFGTHNYLLGLGPDLYFEVIAKDPNAKPSERATWFGLDAFQGAPRLGNWICSADDYAAELANAPTPLGQPLFLSRDDISWQLTVPDDGSLPFEGAYPSLINWGDGVTPPPRKLPDQGVRLTRWEVSHPDAENISKMVHIKDPRVVWASGPQGFKAHFDTPTGEKVLA